jgi:hypothetical protein
MMNEENQILETLSRILWRCAVLGYVLLLVWYLASIAPGDLICRMQGSSFGLTPHECALVNYCGVGLTKIAVLLFFFFPWVAIRLVIRKRKRAVG